MRELDEARDIWYSICMYRAGSLRVFSAENLHLRFKEEEMRTDSSTLSDTNTKASDEVSASKMLCSTTATQFGLLPSTLRFFMIRVRSTPEKKLELIDESTGESTTQIEVPPSIATLVFRVDPVAEPPLYFEVNPVYWLDAESVPIPLPNPFTLGEHTHSSATLFDVNTGDQHETFKFNVNVLQNGHAMSLPDPSIDNQASRVIM